MKKHAIIFASLALSCLVLSAPLSAGAVSSSQTEASSLYIITVQPELPVTERSELELTALEMTQTWQNPNPRRQLALKSVSRAGCSVYRWSSSAPVVASVDASGLVTALAPGKAVISAYTTQGETLTCTVTVTSEIGKVTLDADVLLLHSIGSQQDLIPTVAVQEPSAVALQWTSSDPSVAVVDADGTVTAVADGKAIVTVRTPEGRSAGCAVYVGQAAADYEKRDRQLTKAALGGMGILGALFLLLGILEPTETILLSTHLLEEVQHFISRAVLLRSGRIAGDVTTAALEERSQSLMDYVRSACGYEPGRVLQALERMDGRGEE